MAHSAPCFCTVTTYQCGFPTKIPVSEVVEAYRQRIDSLEDSIRQIDLEEKEEKELRLAELAVQKTEEKLENGTDEREGRIWFQKPKVGGRRQNS